MAESLAPVFQWIVSGPGTLVFCSAIALFGLTTYLYFLIRLRSVRRQLKAALSHVEETGDGLAFAERFETISEQFGEHPLLGHGWQEFSDSLIWPPQIDGSPLIGNTHEAAVFFHAPSIVQSRVNLRFIQAVPGYLTGGGILGTFIGLVAGISLASTGLGSDNVSEIKQALTPLLQGASVAFLTSVFGLSSSMLFSMLEKAHLHGVEQDVERWNAALDKRLRHVTPELLARKQFDEAVKQTLQLETFNTDMAMSIASALDERLQNTFGPQLGLVINGLDQLKGQQQEFSEELLRRVSETLTRALSGAAGTEMQRLGETLAAMVGVLQQSAAALASNQTDMAQAVTGIIDRMEQAFGQSAQALSSETARLIERLMERMEAAGAAASGDLQQAGEHAAKSISGAAIEAARNFSESAAMVTAGASKFGDVATRVTELHGQHATALGVVQSTLKDLREVHGAFKLSVDPLNNAVQGLRLVNESLDGRLKESRELNQSLAAAASDVRRAQEQMHKAFEEYETRFSGVDESLGRTFKELNQGVEAYSETVRSFVTETEKSFSKALQQLSSVVRGLDESVEEFVRTRGR